MAINPDNFVWKALGIAIADGPTVFPHEEFADEMQVAAAMLQSGYPRALYPCLYDGAGVWAPSNGDEDLYAAALGMYTASLVVGTQSSAPGVGGPVLIERRIMNDLTYKFKAVDASDRGAGWQSIAAGFMGAMKCVGGNGITGLASITGGLFQVSSPDLDEFGRLTLAGRVM